MGQPEQDIPLSREDWQKIKEIFKNTKFEDFEMHPHYWYQGITGIPRHGVELNKVKEIFNKTGLIRRGFKRKSTRGFSYTLFYKEGNNAFTKICYFFDEKPMKIFNAFQINRNLERAVLRRYGLSF